MRCQRSRSGCRSRSGSSRMGRVSCSAARSRLPTITCCQAPIRSGALPRARRCTRAFRWCRRGANGWKPCRRCSVSAPRSHRAPRSSTRGNGSSRTGRNTDLVRGNGDPQTPRQRMLLQALPLRRRSTRMSDGIVSSFTNSRAGAAGTLLFSRSDVERLLTPDACMALVEDAFRQHALGKAPPPGILSLHAEDGGFHIKAALLTLDRPYFAAKTNANFPHNGLRYGLPTIQGVVVLCDAVTGQPLAVMDSMAITALRTAAATAVAAKYLSPTNSRTALICGCGGQE